MIRTLIVTASLLPTIALAMPSLETVVAPACLVSKTKITPKIIGKKDALFLFSVNQEELNLLIAAKHDTSGAPCGGFMNVSQEWQAYSAKFAKVSTESRSQTFLAQFAEPLAKTYRQAEPKYTIQYESQVKQLIGSINDHNIWTVLTDLTNFENRNATSQKGVEAAEWVANHIKGIAKANNRSDVEVYKIDTESRDQNGKARYIQPSVVAKIGKSNEPGVVVGAHMDTIVFFSKRQPGADDDGSGSATIMEAARSILASGMTFKRPIYFIWYAAEEQGLIGSQKVVRTFKQHNIPVAAAIQFDMTGFSANNDPTLWLLSDYVNPTLTDFIAELVTHYVKQPVQKTRCGYACSDHASWHKGGIAAAAPFEARFGTENKYIHSVNDTMDKLSLAHMTNFAKLAVAYAVELAEPN